MSWPKGLKLHETQYVSASDVFEGCPPGLREEIEEEIGSKTTWGDAEHTLIGVERFPKRSDIELVVGGDEWWEKMEILASTFGILVDMET